VVVKVAEVVVVIVAEVVVMVASKEEYEVVMVAIW
jgi:hypothetical protein